MISGKCRGLDLGGVVNMWWSISHLMVKCLEILATLKSEGK